MKNIAIVAALAPLLCLARDTNRYDSVRTEDGVTYAQRGGMTPSNEVVTAVDFATEFRRLGAGTAKGSAAFRDAVGKVSRESSADGAARPLPKYLHALDFDDSYPEAAQEYYSQPHDYGGCSAVRDGGFLCRNFDFPFDERAEFVVRMSAGKDRFASIGVAQVGTNLTEDVVTSGRPSRCYKWLPGATVDGINENGVVVEINAVDAEVDPSKWQDGGDIHPLAAVRWALDRGKSAEDAATNLAARVSFPTGWSQNFHWMLADERETWIVENGVASNVTEVAEKRVMTNFPILPDDCEGKGLERYQLLLGGESITNAWWTPAYLPETSPVRYSDLGTNYESVWERWADKPREAHRGESSGGQEWWQTVHTSVYDITNRVLRIAVQETDDWYVFALKAGGCGADEPDPLKVLAAKGRTAFKVWAYDADIVNASTAEAKELFASVYGPWIRDAYPGSENIIKAARMLASRRERFMIRTRVPTNDCDVVVSWGDGSTTSVRDFPWSYGRSGDCVVDDKGNTLLLVSHDYVRNGVFTVEILGTDYIGFRHQAGSDFDLSGRMSDAECSLVIQCLDLETPVSRHIVNLSSAFAGCRKILRVKSDYAYPLVNVRNCATLFYACPNLKTVEGLSAYGDASGMFKYCYALQHTSVFVTRDVTNAATMYDGCTALADDVSKLVPGPMHRSAAVNVSRMFRNCPHVTANPMPAGFLWEDSEVMWSGTADAFSGCSDDVRSLVPVSWGGSNASISVPGYVAPGGFVHDVVTDDGVSVVEDGVARVVGTGAVERTVVAATNALGRAKADRATTLAGYGITDGATKAEMESGLSATNDYLRTSGGTVRGTLKMSKTFDEYISENITFETEGYRWPTIGGEAGQLLVDADSVSLPSINVYGDSYFQGNFILSGRRFRATEKHSLLDYNVTNTVVEINNHDQGIISTNANDNIATIVFGSSSRFTRIGGTSIDLFGGSTYVNGDLKPNRSVQMTPEQFRFRNRGNINLIELIESYIHAESGSGLAVTPAEYAFSDATLSATQNGANGMTIMAPAIPTEERSVETPNGLLTYDGTNYWLNGETQYDRDVGGDVKASVTLDQRMLTNVVTAVKSCHYDETLGVTWKQVMDDGHIYFIAVTNANVVAQ